MDVFKEKGLLKMLEQDKNQYCWCVDEMAGEPQGSIEEAIDDFLNYYDYYCWDEKNDVEYLEQDALDDYVEIGNPYYYVPGIDGERVIYDLLDNDLPEEFAECDFVYFKKVKKKHLRELSKELTEVFRKWEKSHGYGYRAYVLKETELYRIGDYIDSEGNYK